MSITKIDSDIEVSNMIVNHFEKQLDRSNYWVSFAEGKNGVLIAVNIALIAALASVFSLAAIWCTISIICILVSSAICLYSFFPNTTSAAPKIDTELHENPINLVFYGDIGKIRSVELYIELTLKHYFPTIQEENKNNLVYDLANEVLINCRIASQKYRLFSVAIKADAIALILTCIFFVAA